MGWNPDRPPLEYLERRLRYYKKQLSSFKRIAKEEPIKYVINYFGSKKKWREAAQRTIDRAERRIIEFTDAVNKLKS